MTKEKAQPDIDVIDQVIAREVEEETKKISQVRKLKELHCRMNLWKMET